MFYFFLLLLLLLGEVQSSFFLTVLFFYKYCFNLLFSYSCTTFFSITHIYAIPSHFHSQYPVLSMPVSPLFMFLCWPFPFFPLLSPLLPPLWLLPVCQSSSFFWEAIKNSWKIFQFQNLLPWHSLKKKLRIDKFSFFH